MIRCYECVYYKETSKKGCYGYCTDPKLKRKTAVNAVDFCNSAKKKSIDLQEG